MFSKRYCVLLFVFAYQSLDAAAPPSGQIVQNLSEINQAVIDFMDTKSIKAGTLTIVKDGHLIMRQGFGWQTENLSATTHPDTIFRLASVSKPITASAIATLIGEKKISRSTKAYHYLGIEPWNGILLDSRILDIDIAMLLDHKGGWDRSTSPYGNIVGDTVTISQEMGLDHPADANEMISWVFSKPLDFKPGSKSAYSNFGYQVLGRIVEKASGKPFIDYIQQNLLKDTEAQFYLSRSRPEDRPLNEIWYDGSFDSPSAIDFPENKIVSYVDGGHYYESGDAYGGISASGLNLCRYLQHYYEGSSRRSPSDSSSWNYVFYGGAPGTSTALVQDFTQSQGKVDGVEFALLFNRWVDDIDPLRVSIQSLSAALPDKPTEAGGAIKWENSALWTLNETKELTVKVIRSGPASLAVSVSYTTFSQTASDKGFTPVQGIVDFAAGETEKTISIQIAKTEQTEPVRTFSLELISTGGGAWLEVPFSLPVKIYKAEPPQIISHPTALTIGLPYPTATAQATLSTAATGAPPLAYQWFEEDTLIPGETNSTLTLFDLRLADSGRRFHVKVSNEISSSISKEATLFLLPQPKLQLVSSPEGILKPHYESGLLQQSKNLIDWINAETGSDEPTTRPIENQPIFYRLSLSPETQGNAERQDPKLTP